MLFENSFEVAGRPEQVIALFEDVRLMASFLPGASAGEPAPDGTYPATLVVAFGPKRVSFKGQLTPRVDPAALSGEVIGYASTDMRGAKMSVKMRYQLSPCAQGTLVHLVSDAELTGMLADFARTGGVILTQALLQEFAKGLSAHMAAAAGPRTAQPDAPAAAAQPRALSAFAVLAAMARSLLRSLRIRLRG